MHGEAADEALDFLLLIGTATQAVVLQVLDVDLRGGKDAADEAAVDLDHRAIAERRLRWRPPD